MKVIISHNTLSIHKKRSVKNIPISTITKVRKSVNHEDIQEWGDKKFLRTPNNYSFFDFGTKLSYTVKLNVASVNLK